MLDLIIVPRPEWTGVPWENLCLDAGYRGEPELGVVVLRGYIPPIVARNEEGRELKRDPKKRARRWVVERLHSWLNRFRKLLIRYEHKAQNYFALLAFACAFICFRQLNVI
jgi:transposase